MMDDDAATALAALGHPARLQVFRLLVRAGPDGLSTGAIARHLALPASTLAHHLGTLVAARLVTQDRAGRQVLSRADFAAMRQVLGYVEAECCAGLAADNDAA